MKTPQTAPPEVRAAHEPAPGDTLPCGCTPRQPDAAPATTPVADAGIDVSRIRAITLDLDDTLWPIWPTIARAEAVLQAWLGEHAPATAALCADKAVLREVRLHMNTARPELAHDMSALRRESIRLVLQRAGDDPSLAEPAFEVFFAERQRVDLFADALPALEFLSSRFPVVALSNGNADVHRVGLGAHFKASVSARTFGVGKPHPRIFHAAAEAAGVDSAQVLHIGDDAHLDGVGALNAGMQLAWVNREGQAWAHAPLRPHTTVSDLLALCRQLG
ncbi:MAG: HAD-IA family hydrolase [Hydrogenophaga sp.]|nr:HAD-IA family hydrolase [Hydrogenophaga sp.]